MTFLVALIGFDGTGKTTQEKKLQEMLDEHGIVSIYVHVFSPKSTISSELALNHGVNTLIDLMDRQSDTKSGSILELAVRLPSLLFEAWVTAYIQKNRKEVFIYDRYFYDKIVAIFSSYCSRLSLPFKKRILWVATLLPKPDLAIMFTLRPEVANSRKKEHTIEEATQICELYQELSRILAIKTINAEQEISDIQANIQALCKKRLNIGNT